MVQDAIDIAKIVGNVQKCIIYGAGVYGRKIYELMTMCGVGKSVICFAVSEGQDEKKEVMGLPVLSFAKAERQYPNAMVFVAIKGGEELYNKVKQAHLGDTYLCGKQEINLLFYQMFVKLWDYPIIHNKLFFVSNSGKGYMCNGKYITEELIRQKADVDIVWAVKSMNCEVPIQVRKVEIGTPEYFHEIATSKIWIDNCRKDIHIYKRKGQYYIQTWHGSGPLKKVEKDVESVLPLEYVEKAKHDGEMIDLFLSSTAANSSMYRNSFYSQGEVLECGSPRNDLLFNIGSADIERVRNSLGVRDKNSKLVLYAPTFRKTIENSVKAYDLDADKVIRKLEKRFGEKFIMIVRFHPDLSQNEQLKTLYSECIQVTDYEDTQELLAVSDVLITDYSSILWDFSLQGRPIFLYQNDEEEYLDDRGFYCPLSEWPYPRAHEQEKLYRAIAEFDEHRYRKRVDEFLKRWNSFDDGHASERVVNKILDLIHNA